MQTRHMYLFPGCSDLVNGREGGRNGCGLSDVTLYHCSSAVNLKYSLPSLKATAFWINAWIIAWMFIFSFSAK